MTSISSTPPGFGIANMIQQASTTTSTASLPGVSGLLQTAAGSGGMFGALSGTGSTMNFVNPLTILGGGAASGSLQTIMNQQKITNAKNHIFTTVAAHITTLEKGRKPSADWEKVAAYAMQSGQPLSISLDKKGQVQAMPQGQSDLSKYNIAQQGELQTAGAKTAPHGHFARGVGHLVTRDGDGLENGAAHLFLGVFVEEAEVVGVATLGMR